MAVPAPLGESWFFYHFGNKNWPWEGDSPTTNATGQIMVFVPFLQRKLALGGLVVGQSWGVVGESWVPGIAPHGESVGPGNREWPCQRRWAHHGFCTILAIKTGPGRASRGRVVASRWAPGKEKGRASAACESLFYYDFCNENWPWERES